MQETEQTKYLEECKLNRILEKIQGLFELASCFFLPVKIRFDINDYLPFMEKYDRSENYCECADKYQSGKSNKFRYEPKQKAVFLKDYFGYFTEKQAGSCKSQ